MGNEELDRNQENTEFNYVQEKVKSKTRKRVKKIFSVAGLSLLAGVIFGVAARVSFSAIGEPVGKLLGIETEKEDPPAEPTGPGRNQVTFPTNPVTPTPKPTSAPTLTPTPTQAATDAPTATATDTPTETPTPSPDGDPDGKEPDSGSSNSPLDSYIKMMSQIREVAREVQDSLVRVYAVTRGVNWLDESIETRQELTGILMGDDGVELLILTDYSIIQSADRIEIAFEAVYDGELYSYDKDCNIAIVSVPLEKLSYRTKNSLKYMQLGDSSGLYEGEPVIAVGRPNGYYGALEFGFVSHTGIVSYIVDGELTEFTTDLYLKEGGDGIIADLDGRLVGLIPYSDDESVSMSRIIGIDGIKSLILRLLNGGKVAYFGVRCENIPDDIRVGMGVNNGIYVNEVVSGSPAAAAGIKKGDIIMSTGETQIESVAQFYEYLLGLEADGEISVKIFRPSRTDEPESFETVRLSWKE